jgi:hypothetical protein
MNKISIIKKVQLGKNSFSAENLYSKLNFSFYCVNGRIKHEVISSFETSFFLNDLIKNGQITTESLAKHQISKLENLNNIERSFLYRYQFFQPKECNKCYMIIFDIDEYREYWGYYIYGVLEIE